MNAGTISVVNRAAAAAATNNANKKVIFKNCTAFTDCTSETNIAQIDNTNIDVVMPIYNLIECGDNY